MSLLKTTAPAFLAGGAASLLRIRSVLWTAPLLALMPGANAMESCAGQYSATLLHGLPSPVQVGLDLRDSSITSTAVAQAFTRGMAEAGEPISTAPTVSLSLTYQIVDQGGATENTSGYTTPGSGAGWSDWSGDNAPWLFQGGETAALPDIPNYDAFHPASPAQSALLNLRAEVRPNGSDVVAWVAILQCTVKTTDSQLLAYQIGNVLGRAFGKRVDRQPV